MSARCRPDCLPDVGLDVQPCKMLVSGWVSISMVLPGVPLQTSWKRENLVGKVELSAREARSYVRNCRGTGVTIVIAEGRGNIGQSCRYWSVNLHGRIVCWQKPMYRGLLATYGQAGCPDRADLGPTWKH